MIVVSLTLNVLVPVLASMRRERGWVVAAYGDRTPARDILFAIYAAILLASVALLAGWLIGADRAFVESAAIGLLGIQVVYKVGTAITVEDARRNPVVLSNLGIAVVHGATIVTLLAP
ncbi:hypothetical protein ACFPER_08850 [Agromyces aurantiacus]|uniref:DUF1761 domain-containing protein n=1 Tax=Agromyces aurantiacus TaxID=165814 RepID=A0ABV9R588_9MICO|nr:hypothetical protein [Agromyces aurantiacus]MBM7503578.1 hypothetical protein [Agromyces aurantiacus]